MPNNFIFLKLRFTDSKIFHRDRAEQLSESEKAQHSIWMNNFQASQGAINIRHPDKGIDEWKQKRLQRYAVRYLASCVAWSASRRNPSMITVNLSRSL